MTALTGLLPKLAAFGLAAVVGAAGSLLIATAVLDRRGPVSTAGVAPEYLLAGAPDTPTGPSTPVAFDIVVDSTEPSEAAPGLPPADLGLASAQLQAAAPVAFVNPSGFPRITPVTQFDGGPLAGANCTMASGAMLAQLGFGIVTTGSILRSLQEDQEGGSGLDDVQVALWRGYGVSVEAGAITPNQLKDLIAAGYGAVIQGVYGEIPVGLRLQASYTGGHAIYIDGYYPGDPTTPEAYYVVDPLGRPSAGYEGDWWPASVVDDFATAFGPPGRLLAAWAFPPGGSAPDVVGPDVLPLPSSGGEGSGASPDPGATPGPEPPPEAGDVGAVPPPPFGGIDGAAVIGGLHLIPFLAICAIEPRPPGCPIGVPGTFRVAIPDPGPFTAPVIDIAFVDSDRPNVALVGFTVSPSGPASVRYWRSGVPGGAVQEAATLWSVSLPGGPVVVAQLDVLAATTYHFQIAAGDGASAALSSVGTFTTAGGVKVFDVVLETVADPVIGLTGGLSPYRHIAPNALAPSIDLCTAIGSDGSCRLAPGPGLGPDAAIACLRIGVFGTSNYCLERGPGAAAIPPTACVRATIDLELVGVDAASILVRAFPTSKAILPGGGTTLEGVLEAAASADVGSLSVGCLAPGLTYNLVVDGVGDDRGPLHTVQLAVPGL